MRPWQSALLTRLVLIHEFCQYVRLCQREIDLFGFDPYWMLIFCCCQHANRIYFKATGTENFISHFLFTDINSYSLYNGIKIASITTRCYLPNHFTMFYLSHKLTRICGVFSFLSLFREWWKKLSCICLFMLYTF